MNALEAYLVDHRRRRPHKVMDDLQNAGIISDNCILPEDVERGDAIRAVDWLKKHEEDT